MLCFFFVIVMGNYIPLISYIALISIIIILFYCSLELNRFNPNLNNLKTSLCEFDMFFFVCKVQE